MKKTALLFLALFVLSSVCSAQHSSFTFLRQHDGIATFLYNDDIVVSGDLYMFNTIVRDTNKHTTTVLTVIANKKEHWYVYAGAMAELPDGSRVTTQGSPYKMYYDRDSAVDRAIYFIDMRGEIL